MTTDPKPNSGPPPMNAAKGPPPMPTKQQSGDVELSVDEAESPTDKIIERIPQSLTFFLIAVAVTVLSGLVIPKAVLLTVPILVMLGFWPASLGWRLNKTLPMGGVIINVFSPMGKYAAYLISFGLTPVMLATIGLGGLMSMNEDQGNMFVRFLLVGYGVIAVPATLYLRGKSLRHLGMAD